MILTLSPGGPTRSKPAFWTLCHDGRRGIVPAVDGESAVQLAKRLANAWLEAKPYNFDSDGVLTVTSKHSYDWLEP